MREIKFRAWDGEKMLTVINLPCDSFNGIFSDVGTIVERPCCLENDSVNIHFKGIEIMQYTGLKDKNGKEIYEKDIVKADNFTLDKYHIEFIDGGYCLTHKKLEGYTIDINMMYPSTGCKIEVIGNIYENLELLNN
ncbi:MAG: YopX family protein [Erysipelotrichaceae bacterium]